MLYLEKLKKEKEEKKLHEDKEPVPEHPKPGLDS